MLALWLGLIVLAYGGIIAACTRPSSTTRRHRGLLELFPKEMMAAFGIDRSLPIPGVFLNTYIGSFLWPIIAAIAAIVLATRPARPTPSAAGPRSCSARP